MVSVYACSFTDRIILNVIGPAIIRELKLSDLQFGLLGGLAFGLFYSAFGIPIGWIADRRSRLGVTSICIALWSAMTALCGVASGYGQLLLFRMGVGIGEAGSGPAAHSLISDYYPPQKRASALAIYLTGAPLGALLASFVGGAIAQAFGWRIAFLMVGLPGLVLAVLVRLTLKEPPRGHSEPSSSSDTAPPLWAALGRLLSRPTILNLCIGAILTSLTTSSILTFTPTFLARNFNLTLTGVGLLYGVISGGAGLLGLLLGGFGADRYARKDPRWYAWVPALGSIIALPVFLLGFTNGSVLTSGALIFLGSLLTQFTLAPTFAVVQNLVEPRMRAFAAALILLSMNVFGQSFGPTFTGLLSDTFSGALFSHGDYSAVCRNGAAPYASLATECVRASAGGLARALMVLSGFLAWGSLHYVMAARTIVRDSARTNSETE
jgi:predicted MFS family arabinose efflux permease